MQPTRRSSLFLMELMMAILLFSLAATVCVQVFVKSHTLEKESTELSQAVFASTSVAEIFRSSDDYAEILQEQFPFADITNDCIKIYYADNWVPVASSDASYQLTFATKSSDGFLYGYLYVSEYGNDVSSIYDLELKKYIAKEDLAS